MREKQGAELKEFEIEPFPSFEEWQQSNTEREQGILQERLDQEQKSAQQLKSVAEERAQRLELEDKPQQSYGGMSL